MTKFVVEEDFWGLFPNARIISPSPYSRTSCKKQFIIWLRFIKFNLNDNFLYFYGTLNHEEDIKHATQKNRQTI